MLTKSMKKKVNIGLGIIIFALGFIGHSVFAAENVSFKGTTKLANGDFVTLTGKLTKPQGDGPFPAVVLMHGCAGITGSIDTWADRLASWGYVAIELDSFGPRGEINICERVMAIPFNVRSQDAYDAKSYLSGIAFVDRNRMAAIGFSHGGISTLCVASDSNYAVVAMNANMDPSRKIEVPFQAVVAFYPYCKSELKDSNSPLLILSGELDGWCPPATCRANMPAGKAAQEITLKIYPGAYHGFDIEGMDLVYQGHRIRYDPQASADSIVQVKEFLAKHLK